MFSDLYTKDNAELGRGTGSDVSLNHKSYSPYHQRMLSEIEEEGEYVF